MTEKKEEILNKINEMDSTIQSNPRPAEPPYKAAFIQNIEKQVTETNKLVKTQINKNNVNSAQENKIIRIVKTPKDDKISNSYLLRKQFKSYFPEISVKHARISAGGSYVLELFDEESANKLEEEWDNSFFKGNSGISKIKANCTGLVKHVYEDSSEEAIADNISENYPDAKFELFKNKEKIFNGMIKIIFKDERELDKAMKEHIQIFNSKYPIEPFIHKPKVIKCNICQMFGHVSRLCKNKEKPVCGRCCKDHKTKNCDTNEDEFKCFHCSKTDHTTGSYRCEKMQEKLQILTDRYNGQ